MPFIADSFKMSGYRLRNTFLSKGISPTAPYINAWGEFKFLPQPALKKLEQIHDFKQPSEESENLHPNSGSSSVSRRLDAEVRFIPPRFSDIETCQIGGFPPQTQSPEHTAHGAESQRAGILKGWRLLAVRATLALLAAHMIEINKVRRCGIRRRHWSRSHRRRSHFRGKIRRCLNMISPGLPHGKEEGIAIFGMNDPAAPMRQTELAPLVGTASSVG